MGRYFGSLATIANVWRGTGIVGKLVTAALELNLGETIAALFSTVPGRCLRGRWDSVDEVERVVLAVLLYAAAVFKHVFQKSGAATKKRKRAGVGDDEANAYQEEQGK